MSHYYSKLSNPILTIIRCSIPYYSHASQNKTTNASFQERLMEVNGWSKLKQSCCFISAEIIQLCYNIVHLLRYYCLKKNVKENKSILFETMFLWRKKDTIRKCHTLTLHIFWLLLNTMVLYDLFKNIYSSIWIKSFSIIFDSIVINHYCFYRQYIYLPVRYGTGTDKFIFHFS